MRDEWRPTDLPQSLLRIGRLDRRALLRAAGAIGVAAPFGITARRHAAAAQDAGGAVIRSRPRAEVMQEILTAYPLQRQGALQGGTVIIANLGDLESFNPLVASRSTTLELLSLVFEGLVGAHPVDGSIVPWLADYELAADGVTYTFAIHQDARFHDGAPVTAADAEFTLDTFLDPGSLTYSAYLKDVLKEYRAVNDRTFEIVSNGPIASFLCDVPLVVMPKHVWESIPPSDWAADPGSTGQDAARVVGSGPFRFREWVQDDHATLARNDDYWNQELSRVPYLDELVVQVMADSQARSLALAVGDVDVARVSSTDIARFGNAGKVEVVSSPSLGFVCYACQLDEDKTSLFQDTLVRQALFVALDRQGIVDTVLGGHGEVARSTHSPLSPAYRPDGFDPYDYDPIRARELLAQAGWTDADGDGVVEKNGQRFSFTMLVRSDSSIRVNLATYMQDVWADVGVEMNVERLDPAIVDERINTGNFEMILLGLSWSADPGQGFVFATGNNFYGYSNPEYDRLEAEQRVTLDPAQRVDLIVEQAKIVWDELPIGILSFDKLVLGHTDRLRNVFPSAFGGPWWSVPFWYLE